MSLSLSQLPGRTFTFSKANATTKGAAFYHSLWKLAGYPSAGANPGSANGAIPTNATLGAVPFVNPPSGKTYLTGVSINAGATGTLILYDRIWANSTLSGTVTTTQIFTSPTLTRGPGFLMFIEMYTAIGSSAITVTVSYTDVVNGAGRTSNPDFSFSAVTGQLYECPLAAGDSGVTAVASVLLSATTGNTGDFGVTLARPIVHIPIRQAGRLLKLDAIDLGMPEIPDNTCLSAMLLCTGATGGRFEGSITLAQG